MPRKPEIELPPNLATAIRTGDLQAVKHLYTTFPPSQQQSQPTLHALAHLAISSHHPSILSFTLSQHLQLPSPTDPNPPLLYAACDASSIGIWKVLIEEGGVDVNHYLELGGDPLTSAVVHGDVGLATWLLGRGANPNSDYPLGDYAALVWSVIGERNWTGAGAGASAPTDTSTTNTNTAPTTTGSGSGSGGNGKDGTEMPITLLLHGARIKGTGALIAAADVGNLPAVRVFLSSSSSSSQAQGTAKIDVDLEEVVEYGGYDERKLDDQGTALYCAARGGWVEIVDLLLAAGADRGFRDRKGRRAVDVARKGGHGDVVGRLEGE